MAKHRQRQDRLWAVPLDALECDLGTPLLGHDTTVQEADLARHPISRLGRIPRRLDVLLEFGLGLVLRGGGPVLGFLGSGGEFGQLV